MIQLDVNVLIYAFRPDMPRHAECRAFLQELCDGPADFGIPEMALPQHAEVDPFDEWLEREERNSPVAFVALDGDEVVGYARLYSIPALTHRLENGLTAVRGSHRRRGLATALKRAQISGAAANGFRELVTSSVEGNEAMRAVNERLGYKPLPAWIVVHGAVR